jgi:hypothetical protein
LAEGGPGDPPELSPAFLVPKPAGLQLGIDVGGDGLGTQGFVEATAFSRRR